MNCDKYREGVAAEPSSTDGDSHELQCASCREYRKDMQAFDRNIAEALALPVPDLVLPDLPDIESLENVQSDSDITNSDKPGYDEPSNDKSKVVTLHKPRRIMAPTWLAIAAAVSFAAIIGVRVYDNSVSYDSLADEILAHLDHEPHAMRVTDEAVPDRRLTRVVPADVAVMDHDAGLITYAEVCIINGNKVPHLVVQGERGPVTILLMPDETIKEPVEIQGDNIGGVLLPVGDGSIAIIGDMEENLERIQNEVKVSVTWST